MCIHHDGASGSSGYTPLHYAAPRWPCRVHWAFADKSIHAADLVVTPPLMRAAFAGHASVIAHCFAQVRLWRRRTPMVTRRSTKLLLSSMRRRGPFCCSSARMLTLREWQIPTAVASRQQARWLFAIAKARSPAIFCDDM